jgi:hypothetical protein
LASDITTIEVTFFQVQFLAQMKVKCERTFNKTNIQIKYPYKNNSNIKMSNLQGILRNAKDILTNFRLSPPTK